MLTDEQVNQFKTLYEKRFGEKLSHKDAYEKGANLVRLIKFIYLNDNYPKYYGNTQQKNDSYKNMD